MSLPATRIGDADLPHCSGMVRAVGSRDVIINGRPWSRLGDNNVPHLLPDGDDCIIHSAPISTGSGSVVINGRVAGRISSKILGCTNVAEGSKNVICS